MSTNSTNNFTLGGVEDEASALIKDHPKGASKLFDESPRAFIALALTRARGVQGAAEFFGMSRQGVYRAFSGLWKKFGLWSPRAKKDTST